MEPLDRAATSAPVMFMVETTRTTSRAHGGDMQVDSGAHHFGHVNLALDAAGGQLNVLGDGRPETTSCSATLLAASLGLLLIGQNHGLVVQLHGVLAVSLDQLGVLEHVHLRRTDEGRDEQVVRMVEDLLRACRSAG